MEKDCNYNISTQDSRGTLIPAAELWGIRYPLTPRRINNSYPWCEEWRNKEKENVKKE